ncbi:ANTAR domain-containing protein [Arthrobacter sp. Y81]|uniref:ANTAR domain-containing protein n=1 Tax=Arthrobacter sp. Y81 TaxID=2058897 RepID=UPI0015E322F9|nr:ANTAR domain-containing protein [Arthrobacter sp. Y81]
MTTAGRGPETSLFDENPEGCRPKRTLAHREIIAVAKGILMARHGLDEDTAMQDLLMESRRARKSLRDVSAELMSSTRQPR